MERIKIDELISSFGNDKMYIKDINKFPANDDRINLIENSMTIIDSFLKSPGHKKDEDLIIIKQIVTRAYSALECSLLLLFHKKVFNAISVLREVVEAEYLLRYFIKYPKHIQIWWKSDNFTRIKNYQPSFLRKEIANGNEEFKKAMDDDYKAHSDVFSHISPNSIDAQKKYELFLNKGNQFGIIMCLQDFAIHSYKIANILVVRFFLEEKNKDATEDESHKESLLKILEKSYTILITEQKRLVSLNKLYSKGWIHSLHLRNIINYDNNGKLVILDEKKFSEELFK